MPKQLRMKAEQRVLEQQQSNSELSGQVHELQVHQVELEMQNETLRETQAELDHMRQKYMDMFYEAPIAYMVCNEKGTILELNKRLSHLLGIDKNDLLGSHFGRFAAEPFLDTFYHHCKEVLKAKQPCHCEMALNVKGLHVIIKSMAVVSGQEQHIRVAIIDITQQKQFSQQLLLATQKAEAASQAKSDFLAVMSHELRTPLHGIMGLQNILSKEASYLRDEHRHHLEMAQHSSHILHSLIEDILDLSKAEAGKINVNVDRFDLPTLLEKILVTFVNQAAEKDLNLELIYQDMPDIIEADQSLIRQILFNLIGNAMKFTDQGSIHVIVSYEHELLSVQIKDSGIGIETSKIGLLFEPFVQLTDNASRKGTGLGTTIAMRLAHAMSGNIHVTSTLGEGSTFLLTLPITSVGETRLSSHVDLSQTILSRYTSEATPFTAPENLRVLLAEDDEVSRMVALISLNDAKLNVDVAVHGLEAWEKIQANDYDLLLTDIRMPGIDGIELTRRIRKHEKSNTHRTRIIGLSAHALEDVKQECLAAGMDDFFSKPINPDQLLSHLS